MVLLTLPGFYSDNTSNGYFLLIDLHTHSYPHSDDSFMSVNELIDGSKSAGLDGICLTDHDTFWPDDEIRKLSIKHNFLVFPGCEINTESGHVLVFGLDRYEFGMHRVEFLRASVERAGGAMIAAHPYRRRFLEEPAERPGARNEMLERASQDIFFQMCQGIEGLNAHKMEQIGTVATEFQRPISCLQDLIRELIEGRYQPVDLRQKE